MLTKHTNFQLLFHLIQCFHTRKQFFLMINLNSGSCTSLSSYSSHFNVPQKFITESSSASEAKLNFSCTLKPKVMESFALRFHKLTDRIKIMLLLGCKMWVSWVHSVTGRQCRNCSLDICVSWILANQWLAYWCHFKCTRWVNGLIVFLRGKIKTSKWKCDLHSYYLCRRQRLRTCAGSVSRNQLSPKRESESETGSLISHIVHPADNVDARLSPQMAHDLRSSHKARRKDESNIEENFLFFSPSWPASPGNKAFWDETDPVYCDSASRCLKQVVASNWIQKFSGIPLLFFLLFVFFLARISFHNYCSGQHCRNCS